jgi:hypothetical protein
MDRKTIIIIDLIYNYINANCATRRMKTNKQTNYSSSVTVNYNRPVLS